MANAYYDNDTREKYKVFPERDVLNITVLTKMEGTANTFLFYHIANIH
ncbi:MAG: hypothetical protein H7195_00700 [Chryseobacterium sp.]|nr:hypothetical protein [Chryseobacterium sp.]